MIKLPNDQTKLKSLWLATSFIIWACIWIFFGVSLIKLGLKFLYTYSQTGVLWVLIMPFPLAISHLYFGSMAIVNGVLSVVRKNYAPVPQIQSILLWAILITVFESLQFLKLELEYIFSYEMAMIALIAWHQYTLRKLLPNTKKLTLAALLRLNSQHILFLGLMIVCAVLPALLLSYSSFTGLHH